MTALVLVLVPALAAAALLATGAKRVAMPVLLAVTAALCGIAVHEVAAPDGTPVLGGALRIDGTARLFLVVIEPIALGVALYVWNRTRTTPSVAGLAARFAVPALAFVAAANATLVSQDLLVAWVALEASALAAAPMIVRPGVRSSVQASWRYLLFSVVGLGLALLGFVALGRGLVAEGQVPSFLVDQLPSLVHGPPSHWRTLGVALLVLGLGAKVGLAPLHAWLPEAYDEAPPAVTTLLAAVQSNCALVVLFRVVGALRGGNEDLVSGELVVLGLLSMAVSTAHIVATRNLERLVAYASINHAGVIAIGLGIGGPAAYGLLLYVVSNAFIKAMLFLTAGKIESHFGTKDTRRVSGLIRDLPVSGIFLMVGTFALLGLPPFGSFLGELLILSALVSTGRLVVFAAFCALIAMTFVATGRTIFPMIWGQPTQPRTWPRQTVASAAPKILFVTVLVVLGVYIPQPAGALLAEVAATLGGAR